MANFSTLLIMSTGKCKKSHGLEMRHGNMVNEIVRKKNLETSGYLLSKTGWLDA